MKVLFELDAETLGQIGGDLRVRGGGAADMFSPLTREFLEGVIEGARRKAEKAQAEVAGIQEVCEALRGDRV